MAEASSDPSIASCGRSCSMLLPQLVVSLVESSLQDQLSSASVKEESKRFELWARNIAALQDAHFPSSLEHRLRDDASARGIVKKALLYLEESLQMALSIALGERENEVWDLSSPDEQPVDAHGQPDLGSSELKELGLAIQEGITNLFQLSMIIRKKPEKDEYVKASLTYTIDPTADIIHVGDKYPPAKKGDKWLMERLGIAITRRRQYLLYRKEHQEKMEQVHTLKKNVNGKTVWSGEKASTYYPNETLEDSRPVDLNIGGFVSSARTEYADSSKGKDGASDLLRTPLLPKDSVGVRAEYNQHFECPYCWRPQKVGNKNEWKKHIFSDLRPYVCIFESCGLNMFESQNQWFEHEMRFHRKQWTCQHCKEATAQTRPELEKHMTLAHPDRVQESHIDTLLDACQIPRIDATECPLCTEYGEKFRRINQSKKCDVSLKQFQEHLGRHMEQLALSALPQEEVDEDEGPASDDADSVDTTTTSLDYTPLVNEDDMSGEADASAGGEAQGAKASDDPNVYFDFGVEPETDPELAQALEMSRPEDRTRIDTENARREMLDIILSPGDTSEDEMPARVVYNPVDDILLLKNKGVSFSTTFPPYSISDGSLRVTDIRNRAAMWRRVGYDQIKLLYRGQQLKDDMASARDYGLKDQSEILVVIGNDGLADSSSGHDSDEQEGEDRGRQRAEEAVDERDERPHSMNRASASPYISSLVDPPNHALTSPSIATQSFYRLQQSRLHQTDGPSSVPPSSTTEPNTDPVPVLDDDSKWGSFRIKEKDKEVAGTDESSRPDPVIEPGLVVEDDGWGPFAIMNKKNKKKNKGKAIFEDEYDINLGQASVEGHDGNDGSQPQIKSDPILEPVADDWGWVTTGSKKKKKGKKVTEPEPEPPPIEEAYWGFSASKSRKDKKKREVQFPMDDEELTANTTQAVESVSGDPPDLDQPRHENALESSLRDRDIETEMRDGSLTQEQQKKLMEQLERGNVRLDDEPLVPELTRPKPTTTQELDAISSHLRNTLVPLCRDFSSLPDTSPEEREAAYQTLRDRIGDEVLDNLESINTEGDREAKILKKALFSEAQGNLSHLAKGHMRELARLMAKYQ